MIGGQKKLSAKRHPVRDWMSGVCIAKGAQREESSDGSECWQKLNPGREVGLHPKK